MKRLLIAVLSIIIFFFATPMNATALVFYSANNCTKVALSFFVRRDELVPEYPDISRKFSEVWRKKAAQGLCSNLQYGTLDITEIEVTARGAVVMDFDTGIVLWGHNEDIQLVPASMIKMVAVHVVFDAIRDGIITMDTRVAISDAVAEFSLNRRYANVPLSVDYSPTVRDLLEVVIIRSAGAATIALGEGIFGSEQELIRMMNLKAVELGVEAFFDDSWGISPYNSITAGGMAVMSRALIYEYPEVLEISAIQYIEVDGEERRNSNLLLGEYEGLDGLKTGFTYAAGRCLIATAYRDGRRLISVIMGATTPLRYPETRMMLDHGFEIADIMIRYYRGRSVLYNIDTENEFWSVPLVSGLYEHSIHGRRVEPTYAFQERIHNSFRHFMRFPHLSPFFIIR